MYRYTFQNGDQMTSKLEKAEFLNRLSRLDTLRVIVEGYDEGEGRSIYEKAVRAYNKMIGFTGIIRLTISEKDFLSYLTEDEFLTDREKSVIQFYI